MELPEIGKTYYCFDDGKVTESRRYEVTITEIIPFEKADKELLELWQEEGLSCYWLFEKTDYFIKFKSTEFQDEPNGVFARTKYGGWFGLGNIWNSGRLDIDGSLNQYLEDSIKENKDAKKSQMINSEKYVDGLKAISRQELDILVTEYDNVICLPNWHPNYWVIVYGENQLVSEDEKNSAYNPYTGKYKMLQKGTVKIHINDY